MRKFSSNVSEDTEVVNGRAGIQIQSVSLKKLVFLIIMLWCLPIAAPTKPYFLQLNVANSSNYHSMIYFMFPSHPSIFMVG